MSSSRFPSGELSTGRLVLGARLRACRTVWGTFFFLFDTKFMDSNWIPCLVTVVWDPETMITRTYYGV